MWCVSLYGTDRQVSREVHTGAVRKTQPGRKVATESRRSLQMTTCSPLAEHHLHREPREKRGCDLRLKERLSLQQSVMSHIVRGSPWRARSSVKITAEETNCSTAGAAIAVLPCSERWMRERRRGTGQEGGGGRRLLHFISSKPFQYL